MSWPSSCSTDRVAKAAAARDRGTRASLAGAGSVATAAARLDEETGSRPETAGTLAQLIDLGFPLSLTEQDAFLAERIPAVTITTEAVRPGHATGPPRPRRPRTRRPRRRRAAGIARREPRARTRDGRLRLRRRSRHPGLGHRAALHRLARSLPALPRRSRGLASPLARSAPPCGSQLSPATWLLALRRRCVRALGWRSMARRGRGGDQPGLGSSKPLATPCPGALPPRCPHRLVARARLVPERPVAPEDEVAGMAVACALAVVSLVLIVTNPFGLLFVLPSAHAWLWLAGAQSRSSPTHLPLRHRPGRPPARHRLDGASIRPGARRALVPC